METQTRGSAEERGSYLQQLTAPRDRHVHKKQLICLFQQEQKVLNKFYQYFNIWGKNLKQDEYFLPEPESYSERQLY